MPHRRRVVDSFVHKVELRATADHRVLAEVQLRATPLLKELMRFRQTVQEVAPVGIIRTPWTVRPGLKRHYSVRPNFKLLLLAS